MSKFVHVVFGDSAAGTLKYFFSKNKNEYKGEVITFQEDFSIGPIYEIETEAGLRKRIKWFEKILREISEDNYDEDMKKEFMDTYQSIKNIEKESKIVIWHGENTADQAGLRYLSSRFRDRDLYEVNVSDFHMEDHPGSPYRPRALGECAPEEIPPYIPRVKRLDKEKRDGFINDWEDLRKSKENLRILEDTGIAGVDDGHYDKTILSNCSFNFKKAARIVGATMGRSRQLVGDTYINHRVRQLIDSGKIQYRGRLETMRDLEIKIPGSLNKFFADLFNKNCEPDEDGFYHYLLEETGNNLTVETTNIIRWDTIDLSNKMILDYNDHNFFSLTWFNDGRELIRVNHILVDKIEQKTDIHEDENGKEIKKEAIILFLDDMIDKYLEIQIRPHISIALINQNE